MLQAANHALDRRRPLEFPFGPHLAQSETFDGFADAVVGADRASYQFNSNRLAHRKRPQAAAVVSAAARARSFAMSSGLRSSINASSVALTRLCGFEEPRRLVRILRIPASSTTARTPPAAMTPVPSAAERSTTLPAPKRPTTSWGIVPSRSGTRIRLFFARSTPLRIASGTSLALPRPKPTSPFWSPAATRAQKL